MVIDRIVAISGRGSQSCRSEGSLALYRSGPSHSKI